MCRDLTHKVDAVKPDRAEANRFRFARPMTPPRAPSPPNKLARKGIVTCSASMRAGLELVLLPTIFRWEIGWRDVFAAKPLAVGSRCRAYGLAKCTCK
jgi:hypothetical protein